MNFLERIRKNWKSTSAGIVSIVIGILAIHQRKDIVEGTTAILAGIGLIWAYDAPPKPTNNPE